MLSRSGPRRGGPPLLVLVALGIALSACSSGPSSPTAAPATTTAPDTSTTTGPPTAAQQTAVADGANLADTDTAGVEWLCRPGQSPDPCAASLTATVKPESGPSTIQKGSD